MTEILIANNKNGKMNFKVTQRKMNAWAEARYKKVIPGKDMNLLAYLFLDLQMMGYPVDKAYEKYRNLLKGGPELFFT